MWACNIKTFFSAFIQIKILKGPTTDINFVVLAFFKTTINCLYILVHHLVPEYIHIYAIKIKPLDTRHLSL